MLFYGEAWDGSRDLHGILDFIRYADDKVKLRTLVQHDPAYQQMDSDAYDVIAEFTKAKELIAIKDDYKVKEDINMCEALTKMLQDERKEGREEGLEWGIEQGIERGTLITLYALVQKGRLTLVEAAEEAQMSPQDFEVKIKQYS